MKHQSRRYGVYRFSNGQYTLSTMTAGIRHLDHRVRPTKKKRMTMAAFKKVCRRYRSLFFVAAVLSAAQGFLVVFTLSTLLLIISLSQRKKAVSDPK